MHDIHETREERSKPEAGAQRPERRVVLRARPVVARPRNAFAYAGSVGALLA